VRMRENQKARQMMIICLECNKNPSAAVAELVTLD